MKLTEKHRKEIIKVLKENLYTGINSKYLIYNITPRYSARILELKRQGYSFRKKVEYIGGSRFDRVWLVSEPGKKIERKPARYNFVGNTAIPIYA